MAVMITAALTLFAAAATHNFLAPTGQTMDRGEVTMQMHALGGWNQLLYGVTDQIELSFAAPVIPVVGALGVRVALTGADTAGKLVVGAGVAAPMLTMEEHEDLLAWASVTAAYQAGRVDVHASAWAASATQDDSPSLAVASIGLGVRTGKGSALFVDAGKFSLEGDEPLRGFQLGLKLLGKNFDTDVGLVVPVFADRLILFPMVSMTFHR